MSPSAVYITGKLAATPSRTRPSASCASASAVTWNCRATFDAERYAGMTIPQIGILLFNLVSQLALRCLGV